MLSKELLFIQHPTGWTQRNTGNCATHQFLVNVLLFGKPDAPMVKVL